MQLACSMMAFFFISKRSISVFALSGRGGLAGTCHKAGSCTSVVRAVVWWELGLPGLLTPTYWFQSRHRYFRKNFGLAGAIMADLAYGTGYACWRFRRWVQRKPDFDPPQSLADFWRHSVFYRGGRRGPSPTGSGPLKLHPNGKKLRCGQTQPLISCSWQTARRCARPPQLRLGEASIDFVRRWRRGRCKSSPDVIVDRVGRKLRAPVLLALQTDLGQECRKATRLAK